MAAASIMAAPAALPAPSPGASSAVGATAASASEPVDQQPATEVLVKIRTTMMKTVREWKSASLALDMTVRSLSLFLSCVF